ncbi:alpha/beta fold hydrolase [Rhodococcus sp. NPDC059968]|uniref:alpha/beta fold hydrolase n=1 Tax=Rhodococcus sp. NPDC059968 TaxID=3347017 RepID=UPI00366CE773
MTIYPGAVCGQLNVRGASVEYYESNAPAVGATGDGAAPVVMLHGTGGSAATTFRALFPMLATKYRVIAPSFDSESADELTLEDLVDQAVAVIQDQAPGVPVTLLGHSLGAVVAAQLAATRPELVENLVLVSGWVRTDPHQLLRNDLWHQLHGIGGPSLGAFMTLCTYSGDFLAARTTQEIETLVVEAADGPDRRAAMRLNRTIDLTETLPSIEAETLVVGCELDFMAPVRQAKQLFGGIKNACYYEIRSGHSVTRERPAELFFVVHDFLRSKPKYLPGTVIPRLSA